MKKKKFDAVKMTREIRDQLSDIYWKDKVAYVENIKTATERFKSDLKKHKRCKEYSV